MATDRKIGGIFVEIFSKGLESVQSGLGKLKESAVSAASQLERLGKISERAFAIGTASILGFVRAADPYRFDRLTGTFEAIAVQIGSIFLPVLERAVRSLQIVLDAFRSLTPAQKDNIERWVETGLAVALAGSLFARLAPVLSLVATGVRLVGAAIGIASGGIVPLLGLLASLLVGWLAFREGSDRAGEGAGFLEKAFSALQVVVEYLQAAWNALLTGLSAFWERAGPTIVATAQAIWTGLVDLWERVQPVFVALWEAVGVVATAFVDMVEAVLPTLRELWAAVSEFIGRVYGVFVNLVSAVVPVITRLIGYLVSGFQLVRAVFSAVWNALQPVFSLIADLIGIVGDAFVWLGGIFKDVFASMADWLDYLKPAFDFVVNAMITAVQLLGRVMRTVFEAMRLAVLQAVRDMIYMGTLASEISRGNVFGASAVADAAASEFDARLSRRAKERAAAANRERAGETGTPAPTEKKATGTPSGPTGDHTPSANPKLEFTGLIDAWRRAQQATQRENSAEAERLRLAQRTADSTAEGTTWLRRLYEVWTGSGGTAATDPFST